MICCCSALTFAVARTFKLHMHAKTDRHLTGLDRTSRRGILVNDCLDPLVCTDLVFWVDDPWPVLESRKA
jgi:hypothetical protein